MELQTEKFAEPRIWTTSLGGAGGKVTGSSHLAAINVYDKYYYGLFDVGMLQGAEEKAEFAYPLSGKNIDFVVVTHGHFDHIGGLPLLKEFNGKIYGTQETFLQAHELLVDAVNNYERKSAAKLEIDRDTLKELRRKFWLILKHPESATNEEDNQEVIQKMEEIRSHVPYTMEDVERIEKHFCPVEPYTDIKIAPGIVIRLIPASTHQNGAISIEMYVGSYGEKSVAFTFSGDVGPQESLLYKPAEYKPNPLMKYCAIEGTHGIVEKMGFVRQSEKRVEQIVWNTIRKKKTTVFVGFSLDRLPKILFILNRMIDKYNIQVPILLDAPLAWRLMQIYQSCYRTGRSEWFKDLGNEPFDTNEVWVTNALQSHQDAMYLEGPKIVLTAQAFGEGGRVIDYFDRYVQDDNATFVFAAWLSPDCTSKKLLDCPYGEMVVLHGRTYVKHCETIQIEGFTSHGYFQDYLSYLHQYPNLQGISVVHANPEEREQLVDRYQEIFDFPVIAPDLYHTEKSIKNVVEYTPHEMITHSKEECLDVFDPVIL